MSFLSWLRMGASVQPTRCRAKHRPAAPRFRPRLEVLEDRIVPSTLTVTNNLDNGSAGSLRYEIAHAKKGDTIVFAPSLDGQTIVLGGSELDIAKNLTIQGPGANLLTINGGRQISSPNGSRVFAVEKHTTVTLSGLTITGGGGTADAGYGYSSPYDNDGGGILNLGTLTVSGCTVSGNYADPNSASSYGGGIYNAGTLTVSNSTVSGNYATYVMDVGLNPAPTNDGGGIYNAGALTVSNSTLSGNFAHSDGGGIYNAGTAKVSGCTLSSNVAVYYGGGIYNAGTAAALTVIDSIFSGNYTDTHNGYDVYGPYTDGGGNTFS
jgi:hypothetical protein